MTTGTSGIFKKSLPLLALIAFYFVSRVTFLDADIPHWDESHYCAIDEFYYTVHAFDLVEHNKTGINPLYYVNDYPLPVNLVQQYLTYATLKVFGDNYFGLRLSAVVCGFVVVSLLFRLLEKRFGVVYAIVGTVFLLVDFGFVMASRIVEPTIVRMAAMMVTMYWLSFAELSSLNPKTLFAAGFLGCFMFVFIYPTNAFVLGGSLASVLLLAFYHSGQGSKLSTAMRAVFIPAAGALVAMAIFLACYAVFFDIQRLPYIMQWQNRVATSGQNESLVMKLAGNMLAVKGASFFKVNTLLWLAFFAGMVVFVFTTVKGFIKQSLNQVDLVIASFLAVFMMQTLFVNDYPMRKLIILLPFVCYIMLFLFHTYSKKQKVAAIALSLIPLYSVYVALAKDIKFIYGNPYFGYREAMKGLKVYDDKILAGGWVYGFRLYNNYVPVTSWYAYYHDRSAFYTLMKDAPAAIHAAGTLYYAGEPFAGEMKKIGYVPRHTVMVSKDPKYTDIQFYRQDSLH